MVLAVITRSVQSQGGKLPATSAFEREASVISDRSRIQRPRRIHVNTCAREVLRPISCAGGPGIIESLKQAASEQKDGFLQDRVVSRGSW